MSDYSNGFKSRRGDVPKQVSSILDDMRWEERLERARIRRAEVLRLKSEREAAGETPISETEAETVAATRIVSVPAVVAAPRAANARGVLWATLAASVAVAAVFAGSALRNGDASETGGLAGWFGSGDAETPSDVLATAVPSDVTATTASEDVVASIAQPETVATVAEPETVATAASEDAMPTTLPENDVASAINLPDDGTIVTQPLDLAGLPSTFAPASVPETSRGDGVSATRQQDPVTVAPEPTEAAGGTSASFEVASRAPGGSFLTEQGAQTLARPSVDTSVDVATVNDSRLPIAATEAVPYAATQAAPSTSQQSILTLAAVPAEARQTPSIAPFEALGSARTPQALASQGEAETGWTPAAGLGVALPMRLSVFAPSQLEAAPVEAVLATLEAGTGTDSAMSKVNFTVSETHVRFYREADLVSAQKVAALTGGSVRDFTDYAPRPPEGTVEVWLAGVAAPGSVPDTQSAVAVAVASVTSATQAAVTQQPSTTTVARATPTAAVPAVSGTPSAATDRGGALGGGLFGSGGALGGRKSVAAPAAPAQPSFRNVNAGAVLGALTGNKKAGASTVNVRVRN